MVDGKPSSKLAFNRLLIGIGVYLGNICILFASFVSLPI